MSHLTSGHVGRESRKRPRSSLPVNGNTSLPTPSRADDHDAKRVRSAPRERTAGVLPESANKERPSAAMFDRLFTTTPLPKSLRARLPAEPASQSPKIAKQSTPTSTPRLQTGGLSPDDLELATSTFSQFGDDIDEISLLGLAAIEHADSRNRRKSPVSFLDDISMKMESPGNFSIDKLLEDHEPEFTGHILDTPTLLKQSPRTMDDSVNGILDELMTAVADTQAALGDEQSEDILPHDFTMPEVVQSSKQAQDRTHGVIQSPVQGGLESDPDTGLKQMPYATLEYINTPARPMEENKCMEYMLQSTPKPTATIHNPHSVQRTPPHKELAFVDSLQPPAQLTGTIDPQGESFASTTIDAENDHEDPFAVHKGSTNTDFRLATSTPMTNVALHAFDRRLKEPGNVLGSAIRLESSQGTWPPGQDHTFEEQLRDARKTATFKLSTPIISRIDKLHKVGCSEPRLKASKPTTPPPRKRYSMDIPLSRSGVTIELWENHDSVVRQRRSVSPALDVTLGTDVKTPPPKNRVAMDVPLSRGQTPEEVWRAGEADSRRRRVLLTPEPRRRTSSSLNLMVDESPQCNNSIEPAESSSVDSLRMGLPKMPKLDFGREVRHARTLSEPTDVPILLPPLQDSDEQDNVVVVDDDESESPEQQNVVDTEVATTGLEAQPPQHMVRTQRRSLTGQHFTPQSSKLRLLARHLEDDKETRPESESLSIEQAATESLTPKSLRRKQLSDDINLDFASETKPQFSHPEDESAESIHGSEKEAEEVASSRETDTFVATEKATGRGQVGIATPVFTLKRKRPMNETPLAMPETSISALPSVAKPLGKTKANHRNGLKAPKVTKLATFGILPEVLPRSRRERKKPAEFWKIQSSSAVKDDSDMDLVSQPTAELLKRKPTNTTAHETSNEQITTADQASHPLPKKRRLRPSEFEGPISSHCKIQGSSKGKAPVRQPKKQIPSHNFED
ncbi:protein of unknown function [Taphrina deformans PYCC 5710]|uniref:Uncharacterized protein n=1 Tax=Taphrina deformans (strain PYCC 5710 / ATCC 11124 / CBS 356.35 / IMI 108563 / JCM 9778 / NBRC 8474) TaxID=1097556 RepID=R4XGT6_TAPDE|nr:protein of unknown function [Taphrina deformans PYCC 5710]|eukprot:CCG83702.1 protein of unknown function [Taphrina deformans PYCC 5710]